MDQDQNTVSMIQMFPYPVFCVQNGIVTESNYSAKQLSIESGMKIAELLETGKDEYESFSQGALSLTLQIQKCKFISTVMRSNGAFIFHIHGNIDVEETRSMALAAQCIREPLTGIMSVCDQFAEKDLEQPMSATLNRNTYRILRILNNMTDAATCKDRSYNMETQDVVSILNEIADKSMQLAEAANRKVVFETISSRVYTRCDRDMLERAYYNLLSNAIKYSPENSTIHITLKQAGIRILLSIKNSCDHILADELGTMFFRYRRNPGIEDSNRGVGLGISVVRSIASAHNGTLLLTQDSNQDVTFTLSIGLTTNSNTLRSPKCQIDYAGGRDHGLLELSDVLPSELYKS